MAPASRVRSDAICDAARDRTMYRDVEVVDLVPSRSSSGGKPVFVDPHGRRARWTGVVGRLAAGATVLYLILVVASLVGAPWVPRVGLPSVGPAPRTVHTTPAVTLPKSAQRQSPPNLTRTTLAPASPVTTPAGSSGGGTAVTGPPATAARTATTSVPTSQPRNAPTTTTPSRSTGTTAPPGRSGTAPGKGR